MGKRNRPKDPAAVDDPKRKGAKQPFRFDPHRAGRLDDASRFVYLPPQRVIELLDLPRPALVVDFGAGTGTYAIRIAQARADATVFAVDEQSEMLDRLRAKPEAQSLHNLHPMLIEDMGLIPRLADRVLALNVLHELGDEALRWVGALVAEDGFALFIDWNAEVDRPVGPPRDHVYGPREAAERLERLGFAVETLSQFPYHYALRARPVSPRRM